MSDLILVGGVALALLLSAEVVILTILWVRKWRRRSTTEYITEMRARGLALLFSTHPPEVLSALQLLARFGVGTAAPEVLARLAELAGSSSKGVATLAVRVLKDCARTPVADDTRRAAG